MPIYAYRCDACGFSKDVLQKLGDAPLVDCPECHAPAMKKQVTSAGFQLKGSGWYQTDFRNSGAAPAAKSSQASGEATVSALGKADTTTSDGPSKTDASTGDKPAGASSSDKPAVSSGKPAAGGGSASVPKPAARVPGGGCH